MTLSRSSYKKNILLLLCIVVGTIRLDAQVYKDNVDGFQEEIENIVRKYDMKGLALSVVHKRQPAFTGTWGWRDTLMQFPLGKNDFFRIASVSKVFTAIAVMQLVEEGKLALDKPVSDYLRFKVCNPYYPVLPITIRMLMNHTSSINDRKGYYSFEVLMKADSNCFSNYPPGTRFLYSNFNYNILGAVIEKISGLRFDKYMNRKVLRPLRVDGSFNVDHLNATRFVKIYKHKEGKFIESVPAYTQNSELLSKYVLGESTPFFSPAGGLKTTISGLTNLILAFMQKGSYGRREVLSVNSVREMETISRTKPNYGLSLKYTEALIPGILLVGQTGGAYGLISAFYYHADSGFGFAVISNGCRTNYIDGSGDVLKDISQIIYKYFEQTQL